MGEFKNVSAKEVAEAAGMTKQTVLYHANLGRLDYEVNEQGHRVFDLEDTLERLKDVRRKKRPTKRSIRQPDLHDLAYKLELAISNLGLTDKIKAVEQERDSLLFRHRQLEEKLDRYQGSELVEAIEARDALKEYNEKLLDQIAQSQAQNIALESKTALLEQSVRSLQDRLKPAVDLLMHGQQEEE